MSREIEFRCWDTISEVYIEGVENITLRNFINPSSMIQIDNGAWREAKKFELEQFTGLLDKNGTKIFEGDVVNVPYNYVGTITVKFKDGAYDIANYNLSKVSVIGNIHENPELL